MTSLLRTAVYLLLLTELFLANHGAAQTTTEMMPTGFPVKDSLQPSADLTDIAPDSGTQDGIQVIAPGLKFECYGQITEWRALVTVEDFEAGLRLTHLLYLQVWRPSQDFDGKFDLVGSNLLTYRPRTATVTLDSSNITFANLSSSQISESEQIYFQPDDVLGWYSPTTQGLTRGFGVALHSNKLSSKLLIKASLSEPCQLHKCDEEVQTQSSLPLITLQYEPTNASSSVSLNVTCLELSLPASCVDSTTPGNTSPPTPLPTMPRATTTPTYLYIVAGVVPGAVIILVAIVVFIVCLKCHKSERKCSNCFNSITKSEHNPNYSSTYADPDDFIRLRQPPTKLPPQNSMFFNNTGDSPTPHTPVGFTEYETDGHNHTTTYQANGENHIYHELVKTPEPPPLPDRTSFSSFKKTASLRFSIHSINQFPYTMPNTPAPSCPYIEAVPTVGGGQPYTPQDTPPSSASDVSQGKLTMRKLFHSLDDEGLRVPTAEERELYDDTRVEELYSKLHRPGTKVRDSRDDTFFDQSDIYWEPSHSSSELFNQLAKRKYREIKRSDIRTLDALGGGHFSSVHRGVWEVPGGSVEVAVKRLKSKASETDKVKFLQEAAIMGQFLHPNVIKLQGVVTIGEPVMIVLEVMPKGDLKNFVRSLRSKPKPDDLPNMFVRFCREVAFGMNYLSNKGYVHRDLAARNILLTEDLTCKIADFGMARDLDVDHIYQSQGGKIPIKWTAPEGLKHRQYSSASDVWAYGMCLFEIWTLGRKPYEGTSTDELMNFMESFHCQAPPPGTPREVYRLMVQCWHPVPTSRPRFSEVCTFLNSTDEVLLNWSIADKAIGARVMEIGASLSEGNNLYLDLQYMYSSSNQDTSVNITDV